MLDKLPQGLAIVDQEGNMVYTNAAIMEYSAQESCSLPNRHRSIKVDEFFNRHLTFKDGKTIKDLIQTQKPDEPLVGEAHNENGERKMSVEVDWFSIRFDAVDCKSIILKNMTAIEELQQKKIEEKYLRLLLASVTHDLRTPLNGIYGMLELLDQEQLSWTAVKYLKVAKNTTQLALYLVHDLLDFSQIEANSFSLAYEDAEISAVIDECLALYENEYNKKGLFLNVEYDNSIPFQITIDKSRYKQVLLNLLSNAYKFTTKGGVTIYVSFRSSDGYLITAVTDTGVGIRPENMSKLFKIYTKFEDSHGLNPKGVGLGLTICKKIVEQHGGTITCQSQVDKGTTFTFTVKTHDEMKPRHEEEKITPKKYVPDPVKAVSPISINRINSAKKFDNKNGIVSEKIDEEPHDCNRILIVDDNDTNLMALRGFSKAAGINAVSVFFNAFIKKGTKWIRRDTANKGK